MKMILGVALMMSSIFATDITGIIQSINNAQKTITINGSVIKVMPHTKIEQDACGMGWDRHKKFSDLKNGDLVEIDLVDSGNGLIAEDIEIKCMKNRAY